MARRIVEAVRRTSVKSHPTTFQPPPQITPALTARDIQTTITVFQGLYNISDFAGAILGADACSTTLALECTDTSACGTAISDPAFTLIGNPTSVTWSTLGTINGTTVSYAAACTNYDNGNISLQGACYDRTTALSGSLSDSASSSFTIAQIFEYYGPLAITSGAELLDSLSTAALCTPSSSTTVVSSASPATSTISTTSSIGSFPSPTTTLTLSLTLQDTAISVPPTTTTTAAAGGPTSLPPSPPTASPPHSGLSSAGVTAVAVAVPIGVIAIAAAAGYLFWRRRRMAAGGGVGGGPAMLSGGGQVGGPGGDYGVREIQNVGPYRPG